jgi:carboxymethylenebutenolidase
MVLCIAVAALLASIAEAQQPRCCSFAQFAADPGFRSVHHPPLPFADVDSEKGRWMYLPATTPPVRLYVCGQLESASAVLLLFHEWWGLNEYIRREAEQLSAQLHVPVVAVDLYDGAVTADPQEAARLMQSVSEQRIRQILRTVVEALPARARIATLGWCFGGGWALQAALEAGARAAACVMYYGMPELDTARLRQLHCPVLGIFARRDRWITPELAERFRTAMRQAGKELEFLLYDAEHAFANPSNPRYNAAAARDARERCLRFLRKRLGQ